MEIRKTKPEELDRVMAIYARARKFMAEHDNPSQWGNVKPYREDIVRDIAQGFSHVCVEGKQIVATFYYREGVDPTYLKIYEGEWANDLPYGVVHRIASAGTVKGAGSFCLNWAFGQCGNLKIDTHRDNIVMQNTLKKNGFVYCGIIHLADGDERLAYQKTEQCKRTWALELRSLFLLAFTLFYQALEFSDGVIIGMQTHEPETLVCQIDITDFGYIFHTSYRCLFQHQIIFFKESRSFLLIFCI